MTGLVLLFAVPAFLMGASRVLFTWTAFVPVLIALILLGYEALFDKGQGSYGMTLYGLIALIAAGAAGVGLMVRGIHRGE